LLQPKYSSYLSAEQRTEIVGTVERAVEFHGSPDIAVDDRHGPRLYSRFMGGLLERVKTPPAKPSTRLSRSKRKTPALEVQASLQPPTTTSTPPPSSNYFEPLPARTTTPFDHFAFPTEVDPSVSGGGSALGLTVSEFFYSPLPFDSDLVESMQSLSSLPEMHDASLPGTHVYISRFVLFGRTDAALRSGFGWMEQMPPVDFTKYQQQMDLAYLS